MYKNTEKRLFLTSAIKSFEKTIAIFRENYIIISMRVPTLTSFLEVEQNWLLVFCRPLFVRLYHMKN